MKKTAVIYARANNLKAMEAQLEQLYLFAEAQGFAITNAYYEVIGGHAHVCGRTVWNMVLDAKDGQFSTLLMRDISRISRNSLDALFVMNELEDLGVQLIVQSGSGVVLI